MYKILIVLLLLLPSLGLHAQKTSRIKDSTNKKSASALPPNYSPRKAIVRSAIAPGWGQYTNKKYWKMPLAWAGVGIPAYLFVRNIKQYRETKAAIANFSDGNPANDIEIGQPYYSVRNNIPLLNNFKRDVRQNADYSILFFIVFWGLNVADAAVDAHLKTFNVDDNIGLNLKIGNSELAQTTGISLQYSFGKKRQKRSN
jgi:hypothetical protein